MRRIIVAATLLIAFMAPARADFQEGVATYDRGDYATALREWRPLAEPKPKLKSMPWLMLLLDDPATAVEIFTDDFDSGASALWGNENGSWSASSREHGPEGPGRRAFPLGVRNQSSEIRGSRLPPFPR